MHILKLNLFLQLSPKYWESFISKWWKWFKTG